MRNKILRNETDRAYYVKNRDEILEYRKMLHSKNPENKNSREREYYHRDKVIIAEKRRLWNLEHPGFKSSYLKEWRIKNKDKCKEYTKMNELKRDPQEYKEYQRARRLKVQFGITTLDYDRMYQIQQGCCAICRKHQSTLKTRLAVDHNHETKNVRGLLCFNCNAVLGQSHDDISILERCISYLRKDKREAKVVEEV